MQIKDLFKMDFASEIEAVIKVGEYSEQSATEEINNYIVTEQIASNLEKFLNYYAEPRKDTGIWISGFYGSGKSYLAKIIGYLLENPDLMGVEARDLFKNRLTGLDNSALLETKVAGLSKYRTKTVVFDVSGENLQTAFYKQLLLNFLKSLGLPKNVIGYTEYQLMKTDKYEAFREKIDQISREKTGKDWQEARNIKSSNTTILKESWQQVTGESREEIDQSLERMHYFLENVDADALVNELDAFIDMDDNDYDRIVFIVDEVSEALDKDHIELSELRGTAQHLSQNGEGRYWFIATAQEKLDNILSRKNVDQNDLNILTDRFQLKIHLSSAQVDKVTKERILAKTEEGKKKLREFYRERNGAINDLVNLSGKFDTTIDSEEEFIDFYPFHKYQMRLLKKFLYAVFQQAQAGGSERGMLVTVDRLLKNEGLFAEEIGKFVTSYQLCDYGFPTPDSELQEKFNEAQSDLEDEGQEVDGEKILKTLFFLEKSEDLKRTLDNIAKAYNDDLTYIGEIKKDFEQALQLLEEKNYVMEESREYKITSDVEENLMQEMNTITPNWENRINIVRNKIQELPFITRYATNRLDNKTYNIALRDEKENLLSTKGGEVALTIYNVLNVDDDIEKELEAIKSQYIELDEAVMVPEIKYRDRIDKLAAKIYKHRQMINRYRNTTDEDKKKVIDSFRTIVNNKEGELEQLIEESYENSWLIYDFNEIKLNPDNMKNRIDEIESEMIDKTFSRRLRASLEEGTAEKFISIDNERLIDYCNQEQFAFFDSSGSFTGENLRVVQEIDEECSDKDGRTGSGLIDKFHHKPYGWETSDIMGTLAALMRAGNLKLKYQGNIYRDYENRKVREVFTNSREFKKAKFYTTISQGLTPGKKQKVVDSLLDIDNRGRVNIDYQDNDFQVVKKIRKLASEYISIFTDLKKKVDNGIVDHGRSDIQVLRDFSRRDVENSGLEEMADEFLNNREQFASAIKYINKLAHFVDNEYLDYKNRTGFIAEVENQLTEAEDDELKAEIEELISEFRAIEEKGIVEHIDQLRSKYIELRQKFNRLFQGYFEEFLETTGELQQAAEKKKEEIEAVDISANRIKYNQLEEYIDTGERLSSADFELQENEPKEKNTRSSLKEIIMGTRLKESNIREVKKYIPEPPEEDEEQEKNKTYRLELPLETGNVNHVKNKLDKALRDLEAEKYDKIRIITREGR